MPREEDHRLKAKRNEEFAASLDLSHSINESWAVVAVFYAALHYVEAYFARHGERCINHEDRDKKIKAHQLLRSGYANYSFLYSLSREARYWCTTLPQKAYGMKAMPHLDHVKKLIENVISIEDKAKGVVPAPIAPIKAPLVRPVKIVEDVPRPSPGKPRS
jgi:hypothetical protein